MYLKPGDIFLTKGDSFVSRAIRFLTRDKGESRTEVNHVGIVVAMGTQETAFIVEALTKVKRRLMLSYCNSKSTEVAIFRPALSDGEISRIVARANGYVGRDYGYIKLLAHFIDWCLGGIYLARRIARMDNYPICSWVVAYAYDEVGLDFGVPPEVASPDDIWDYCVAHPEYFFCVHPLSTLK
jgi:hypothetical protein